MAGDYVVESEGEQLVRTRMEEAGSQGERASGSGNLRGWCRAVCSRWSAILRTKRIGSTS